MPAQINALQIDTAGRPENDKTKPSWRKQPMYDNDEHETVAKTLWSETLIEVLCINLKKAKPDAAIIEMLREIKAKGFKPDYINSKVKSELGDAAAGRVRSLLKNV